jgi:hypothetical protein
VAKSKKLTKKQEFERLAELEVAAEKLPEDATIEDILEMIAGVTGEPVTKVHKRFQKIKKKK